MWKDIRILPGTHHFHGCHRAASLQVAEVQTPATERGTYNHAYAQLQWRGRKAAAYVCVPSTRRDINKEGHVCLQQGGTCVPSTCVPSTRRDMRAFNKEGHACLQQGGTCVPSTRRDMRAFNKEGHVCLQPQQWRKESYMHTSTIIMEYTSASAEPALMRIMATFSADHHSQFVHCLRVSYSSGASVYTCRQHWACTLM